MITLRQAEERSGVSNAFISQIESGKVKEPSPVILYKLARAYEVPYDSLMQKAGYPVSDGHKTRQPEVRGELQRFGALTEDEEVALSEYLAFLRSRTRRTRVER